MKAVLLSVKPKWCELIASGKKTIEVRKTAPKLETPFKVYVYCTKERMTRVPSMYAYLHKNEPGACAEYGTIETWGKIGDVIVNPHLASKHVSFGMHGKVIGEFVCDDVITDFRGEHSDDFAKYALLSLDEQKKYGGNKPLYGWHITEPTLFEKPRELGEFVKPCDWNYDCCTCKRAVYELTKAEAKLFYGCDREITRPPQSWCYVDELQ